MAPQKIERTLMRSAFARVLKWSMAHSPAASLLTTVRPHGLALFAPGSEQMQLKRKENVNRPRMTRSQAAATVL